MLDVVLFRLPGDNYAVIFFGVIGLLIGSFLNVVIYRLPKMMQRESDNYVASESGLPLPHKERFNLLVPRSACPHCGHQISAIENIPVFSYLFIHGKCTNCKTHIPIRYPLIELLTAILSTGLVWHFGSGIAGLSAMIFAWFLIAMTFIDLDTQLLPDDLTITLLWLGLLVNLNGTFTSLPNAVLGAVAGYLTLWAVFWIFKFITGKDGMGYGDFKLLSALGAWMGWSMLPLIILVSSAVGACVGIAMIVFKGMGRNTPIPFGPYLAAAGIIALIWGPMLAHRYLEMH